MRILLCHCTSLAGNDISHPRVEHLGIGYLCAVARSQGHQVHIIDANIEKLSVADVVRRILSLGLDFGLIGFSVLSTNYIATRDVIAALRAEGFAGHVTLGGYFPTFLDRQIFEDCPGVDSIVQGEAETSFRLLCEAIDGGRVGAWRDVPGVAFDDAGRIVANPAPPPIVDLDALPFPSRDTLPILLRHRNPVVSVSPARGCYMKCNFCSIIQFYAASGVKPWRERSPSRVVDEIEQVLADPVCRARNTDFVWFCADEFVGLRRDGKVFARRLSEEILRRGLVFRWEIACRTDQVDLELFGLMREAGLRSVYVGAESFSQRQLDSYRKNNTPEANWDAIRVFQRLRLDYTLGTIVFSPDTTIEEFEHNHREIKKIGYRHVTMPLSRLKLFEGTPAARTQRVPEPLVAVGSQERARPLTALRSFALPAAVGSACAGLSGEISEFQMPADPLDVARDALVEDEFFPLDDVYGYAFDDARINRLWWLLVKRNESNELLVKEAISLLDAKLIDGVAFWKLVYTIRDALAVFIDESLDAVRRGEAAAIVVARHDSVIALQLKRLAEFRGFLEGKPMAGIRFEWTIGDARVEYQMPLAGQHRYLPGMEKDVAEREYAQARQENPIRIRIP